MYVLLGQSGLLALAGLAIGYLLKEPKGARVFLTLALASVPANMAVLGAMVYSIAPLDGLLPGTATLDGGYPAYAFWEASGPGDLLRTLLPRHRAPRAGDAVRLLGAGPSLRGHAVVRPARERRAAAGAAARPRSRWPCWAARC